MGTEKNQNWLPALLSLFGTLFYLTLFKEKKNLSVDENTDILILF